MGGEDLLKGKKVLVVDDEEDVLAYLAEHLDACNIEKASTYESAKKLLETRDYDAANLLRIETQALMIRNVPKPNDSYK